jgi:hypothetical protein
MGEDGGTVRMYLAARGTSRLVVRKKKQKERSWGALALKYQQRLKDPRTRMPTTLLRRESCCSEGATGLVLTCSFPSKRRLTNATVATHR